MRAPRSIGSGAAPAQQEALAAAWRDSVMFFEAGETRLGMEVLLDRLEHLAALLPAHALTDWDGNGG
ncbi:MAG: hypothetical protein H6733_06425 [Alphaproteobacteria bacterium]|nr:hypothetical protein [Alphaproteobacteria bacterium]